MAELDLERLRQEKNWVVGEALCKSFSDYHGFGLSRRHAISLRDVVRHYSSLGVDQTSCWAITKMDIQRPLTAHKSVVALGEMALHLSCKDLRAFVKTFVSRSQCNEIAADTVSDRRRRPTDHNVYLVLNRPWLATSATK